MKDGIKRMIPIIISGVTILITLIVQFAVFSVNDEFNWAEFLPQLFINIFLLVTTAVIWINAGTDRAKREEKSAYKDNATIYAKKIKDVTDGGRLGELREFCRMKTEELREQKITTLLANVGIDRHNYDTELRTANITELEQRYERRQIRVIRRIQSGRVRVKTVRAMDLLSDSKASDDCGVNYDEQTDKALRISFRAVRSIFTALLLAVLAIDPAQDIMNIAAWVLFFTRLITIIWTAYSAEREGYSRIVETKNKVMLRRIAFLCEFDEWQKKSGGI